MAITNTLHSNKGRIIFVEDEKAIVDMYHDIFEQEGYDFMSTMDIKEALANTEFEQPDLVLLDIIIPTPDNTMAEQGYDYLAAVKKNPKTKDIPVVVFTNLDTPQDRQKCRDLGAAAYMFKRECTPREVVDTVAGIIERKRGRKQVLLL